MYTKNLIIFSIAMAIMCVCVDSLAVKRKAHKTKVRKSKRPISIPSYGCQFPLMEIGNCGCRGPREPPCTFATIDPVPVCGCQKNIVDMTNFRYMGPFDSAGSLTMEVPNTAYVPTVINVPNAGCVAPVNLPCGWPTDTCPCQMPARTLPIYPYGSLTAIEIPTVNILEWQAAGYPERFAQVSPQYVPMCCGCLNTPCACGRNLPCGCPAPVPYQTVYTCGQQVTLPCGCQGLICGCTNPTCDFQVQIEVPSCGCGALGCDCPVPACSVPGCMCGGSYLRQVTLQPPFL